MKKIFHQKIERFLKKEKNLLAFDFWNYNQNLELENSLKNYKFSVKNTPISLFKVFNKLKKRNLYEFNDFLDFLEKNQLWSEKESLEYSINHYITKYGPLKIQALLRKKGYRKEKIKETLQSISKDIWMKYALQHIRFNHSKFKNLESKELKKKIISFLKAKGYTKSIIHHVLKNKKIDKSFF
ncbi:MAG: hypothetical protein ACK4UJ_02870 [Leptonema sp. (in: bacteria)]